VSNFHLREYDVQFWLGKPETSPLWEPSRWTRLRPAFDALVRVGRNPVKVHSSQIDRSTKKHVRFGRLAWSVESDGKWLHQTGGSRYFEFLEVWAPNGGVCQREGRSPDTYFDITNLQGAGGYEWFAVAALAVEIPEAARHEVLTRIDAAISAEFSEVNSATARRPWGYPWGDGFGDGMQELSNAVTHLLTTHFGRLPLELLRGSWKLWRKTSSGSFESSTASESSSARSALGSLRVQTTERKELRDRRGQLLTLLNGWDPAGLLHSGAPRDEYDCIVDNLFSLLSRSSSETEVAAFLEEAVSQHFGVEAPDADRFAAKAVAWFRILSHDGG
jgi:hypothetical protein